MLRQNEFADHGEAVEERRASLEDIASKDAAAEASLHARKQQSADKLHETSVAGKKAAARASNEHVADVRQRHAIDEAIEASARKQEAIEHELKEELAAALRKDQLDAKIERIKDLE